MIDRLDDGRPGAGLSAVEESLEHECDTVLVVRGGHLVGGLEREGRAFADGDAVAGPPDISTSASWSPNATTSAAETPRSAASSASAASFVTPRVMTSTNVSPVSVTSASSPPSSARLFEHLLEVGVRDPREQLCSSARSTRARRTADTSLRVAASPPGPAAPRTPARCRSGARAPRRRRSRARTSRRPRTTRCATSGGSGWCRTISSLSRS